MVHAFRGVYFAKHHSEMAAKGDAGTLNSPYGHATIARSAISQHCLPPKTQGTI